MKKLLLLFLFVGNSYAEDRDFLTEWQGLIHAGVMSCNYHINAKAATRAGEALFTEYYERAPTLEEKLRAKLNSPHNAVIGYADGGITCKFIKRQLAAHIY